MIHLHLCITIFILIEMCFDFENGGNCQKKVFNKYTHLDICLNRQQEYVILDGRLIDLSFSVLLC